MLYALTGRQPKRAMSEETEIAEKVEALLQGPLQESLDGQGYQLLDVQYYRFEGRQILRLLIDKPEGIGINDCSAVSELAGRILEVEDPVPGQFSLEVSSPGIFRPLKRARDYHQAIGKLARFNLAPETVSEGGGQIVRGVIVEVKEAELLVECDGKSLELPMAGIRSARLDPDL